MFQAAAFGRIPWAEAVARFAEWTGSRSGQLVGFGSRAAVPFNLMTNLPAECGEDWVASGGGDPQINSRVRIGSAAAELEICDERHFSTADDMRRHREYGQWIERYDCRFTCLTPLVRQDATLIGLAVIRSAAQGPIADDERRAFAALAPHVRTAVRTQMEVEAEGLDLLANSLGALSVAAFICDIFGYVRVMSPRAEDLVASGRWVECRNNRMRAARAQETSLINGAIERAIATRTSISISSPDPFVVHSLDGEPLALEAVPLPADHAFRFSAAALLIARPPRNDEKRAAELSRLLFGLTPMEAVVASHIVSGRGPQVIAERAGISVGTVRSHVRRIFAKAGTASLIEFAAKLGRRL